ncbi:Polyribonucleotide nucleotidyltransferase [Hordeum vulgare]|nr:Polyribonucleotide nucleotidyltransferase [Hordeum vulgare]
MRPRMTYDVAVWHARRPKTDLNYLEVESQAVAEWLVPHGIRMEDMPEKKAQKRPAKKVKFWEQFRSSDDEE